MEKALDGFTVDYGVSSEVLAAEAEFYAQPQAPAHEHTMLANGVADCCACCDDVRSGNACKCGALDGMLAEAAQIAAAEMADR